MKFIVLVGLVLLAILPPQISSAQNLTVATKNFCPQYGFENKTAVRFCPFCGTSLPRLPAGAFAATWFTSDLLTLKQSDHALDSPPEPATAALIATGLMMSAMGFFTGGFIGYAIDHSDDDEYGSGIGASIGESLFLPVGVHLANRRRGNFPLSWLASVGIAGAGILVAINADDPSTLLLVPILQVAVCTAIERSTDRLR